MHRMYENEDIAVFWDSGKCRHARKCVGGSPRTFDPTKKPWIDLTKAPTSEVWKAVSECPTGALTCIYRHDIDITISKDGYKSEAYAGEKKAGECLYLVTPDGWNIYHTEVLPEYQNKGIAKRLVYKVVEAAEREKANIIPTCPYAVKILGI